MKRIISISLVVLMLAALLVGCGSSDSADPTGNYVVKSIDGKTIDEAFEEAAKAAGSINEAYLELLQIDKPEEIMTIAIKSDGTAVIGGAFVGTELSGTWKQDGDKVSITVTGATGETETSEFTFKDNELTSKEDDKVYVFVKK